MNDESVDAVALSIYGTLAEGGWSDPSGSWRECIKEVEAAWWALPEWERDDYRRAAKEAIAVAVGLNMVVAARSERNPSHELGSVQVPPDTTPPGEPSGSGR